MAKNARNRKTSLNELNENSNAQSPEAVDETNELDISKDSDEEQIVVDNLNEENNEKIDIKPDEETFAENDDENSVLVENQNLEKCNESDLNKLADEENAEKAELDRLETENSNKMEWKESDMIEAPYKDINGNFTHIPLFQESQSDFQLCSNKDMLLTEPEKMQSNSITNSVLNFQVELDRSVKTNCKINDTNDECKINYKEEQPLKSLDDEKVEENVKELINGNENSLACFQVDTENNELPAVKEEEIKDEEDKLPELAVEGTTEASENFTEGNIF